jgi:hypothetical protein
MRYLVLKGEVVENIIQCGPATIAEMTAMMHCDGFVRSEPEDPIYHVSPEDALRGAAGLQSVDGQLLDQQGNAIAVIVEKKI